MRNNESVIDCTEGLGKAFTEKEKEKKQMEIMASDGNYPLALLAKRYPLADAATLCRRIVAHLELYPNSTYKQAQVAVIDRLESYPSLAEEMDIDRRWKALGSPRGSFHFYAANMGYHADKTRNESDLIDKLTVILPTVKNLQTALAMLADEEKQLTASIKKVAKDYREATDPTNKILRNFKF